MLAALSLITLADILFYEEPDGWGSGLFALTMLAAVLLSQPQCVKTLAGRAAALMGATLAIDMVLEPGTLNIISFCLLLVTLIVMEKRHSLPSAPLWLKDVIAFSLATAKIWNHNLFKINAILKKRYAAQDRGSARRIGHVAVPVMLSILFCWLFAEANPVLMQALEKFDWSRVAKLLSLWRWLFWLSCGTVIWALLRPRFPMAKQLGQRADINIEAFVNRNSIALSLIVFNVLFALQNASDIWYLWQQKSLPEGVSYAEYAHAGAYPLIATALLAGVYVLITFGNGGGKYQSRLSRQLVYVWIAQNIFLVVSAIDRTLHYVAAYSLTSLRVAALIWMGLVAFGHMTLVVRVAWNRSNLWLNNAKMHALAAVVYACCFMNFSGFIADYNVRHCREMTGDGPGLDVSYLKSLGWQAAPALHWFQENVKYDAGGLIQRNPAVTLSPLPTAGFAADELDADLAKTFNNHWQAWTLLRYWRLKETELRTHP